MLELECELMRQKSSLVDESKNSETPELIAPKPEEALFPQRPPFAFASASE